MKRSDIPDAHVVDLARAWQVSVRAIPIRQALAFPMYPSGTAPGVVEALVAEGMPEKLAVSKVEHLCDRGLLEYGTSPYHAWPVSD